MITKVTLLLLPYLAVLSQAELSSCFKENKTMPNTFIQLVLTNISNLYSCQEACKKAFSCSQFTWYSSTHTFLSDLCFLFPSGPATEVCNDCITGPAEINTEGFLCERTEENVLLAKPNILSASSCHSLCFFTPSCTVFTWLSDHHLCFLYSACHLRQTGCQGCFSAAAVCLEELWTLEDQQFIAINDTQDDSTEDIEEDINIEYRIYS